MPSDQPHRACSVCHQPFGPGNEPRLFEDGCAFCDDCAYEISMIETPIAS